MTLLVTLSTLLFSACSQIEEQERFQISDTGTDDIGFNMATAVSKAMTETQTSSLTASKNVDLYYYDTAEGGSTKALYFTYIPEPNSNNAFKWSKARAIDGDDALNGDCVKWSDLDLPVRFFSMHGGETLGPVAMNATSANNATPTSNLNPKLNDNDFVNDVDYVYYTGVYTERPSNRNINAAFKHAFTKIMITAPHIGNNSLYISKINIKNLKADENIKPTITDDAISWGVTSSCSYEYFAQTPINTFDSSQILIFPQQTDPLGVNNNAIDSNELGNKAYIEVIYRMDNENGLPLVGYENEDDFEDYNPGLNMDDDHSGGVYVKVAFPLNVTFVNNKFYDLKLPIGNNPLVGTNNGYLITDNYVDENGNIISGGEVPDKEDGEPIVSVPDCIGIEASVLGWDGNNLGL